MTVFITHPACLEHITTPSHLSALTGLRAIEQALEHERFMFLVREQCPRAEIETIALCHSMEYVERIRMAVPQAGSAENSLTHGHGDRPPC
jgi:acetoin utilization deacetylase AcuC-like enzyme